MSGIDGFAVEAALAKFDLVARAAKDCPTLKRLPNGDWKGRCPFGGCKAFHVVPSKRMFYCFSCGEGGDAIAYIRRLTGASFSEAMAEINCSEWKTTAGPLADRWIEKQADQARRDEQTRAQKIAAGRKVWAGAGPIAGTLGEAYLLGRGLAAPFPPTLRFNPELRVRLETADGRTKSATMPAMIAAVQGARGQVQTVHRTYLDQAGGKADLIGGAKRLHGPARGAAVRLTPMRSELWLTEGIETGLAIAESVRAAGMDQVAVWAAISTVGLVNLEFAAGATPSRILICADHDASGAGETYATRAVARFQSMGLSAAWRMPKTLGVDWLDQALGNQDGKGGNL